MPRRTTLPRYINGQSAAYYDQAVHDEYNRIYDQVSYSWRFRNLRRWDSHNWIDNWSSVRYRGVRLQALRRQVQQSGNEMLIAALPAPSVVDILVAERVLTSDGVVPPVVHRAPHTETSAPALQIALDVLPLEDELEQYEFGTELEHYTAENITRMRLAQLVTEAGVPATVENYNHSLRNHWKMITDGSLGDYRRGTEVVSPILRGANGFNQLANVCKVMEENGGTVRRQAGLHVHVGMRDRDLAVWKRLLKLYAHFEDSIDTITARSRRGNDNGYARSTKVRVLANGEAIDAATTLEDLSRAYCMGNRFMKVNTTAYWRHGTVEFRQHQGTVNAAKAQHWTRLCLRLVNAAVNGIEPTGEDTLQNLASTINLPADSLAFYERRVGELARVRTERR